MANSEGSLISKYSRKHKGLNAMLALCGRLQDHCDLQFWVLDKKVGNHRFNRYTVRHDRYTEKRRLNNAYNRVRGNGRLETAAKRCASSQNIKIKVCDKVPLPSGFSFQFWILYGVWAIASASCS
jgi:hypothetical protein